jgi:translation initiation factor IF-3
MLCCGADAVHPYFFMFPLLWRWATIANTDHQINEEIRDKEVRLIGADGEQLGIMSAEEALRIATEQEYDLVKIAPGSNPPVCKIMDYGKYRFEQTKKEKEAKKNQRVIEIKEIRMSPSIDTNDFNTKLKNGQKFLSEGNRLKVSVRFRGREMAHTDIGGVILRDFAAKCADIANMDKAPKLEGRNMSMFLSPKPQTAPKKPGKPKAPKAETAAEETAGTGDTVEA